MSHRLREIQAGYPVLMHRQDVNIRVLINGCFLLKNAVKPFISVGKVVMFCNDSFTEFRVLTAKKTEQETVCYNNTLTTMGDEEHLKSICGGNSSQVTVLIAGGKQGEM